MTYEERKALVGVMKDQIESWEFEDPREDWWKWQHQYARAADQIEADGKRIAELEAALNGLLDEITLNKGDVLDSRAAGMAYAALLLGGKG